MKKWHIKFERFEFYKDEANVFKSFVNIRENNFRLFEYKGFRLQIPAIRIYESQSCNTPTCYGTFYLCVLKLSAKIEGHLKKVDWNKEIKWNWKIK